MEQNRRRLGSDSTTLGFALARFKATLFLGFRFVDRGNNGTEVNPKFLFRFSLSSSSPLFKSRERERERAINSGVSGKWAVFYIILFV